MPTDNEFTRILQWPGYRVYRHVINEKAKVLELWVRRKRGSSGCGPFLKLANMLLDHLDGILNYCKTKVPLGVVEAVNGNIKTIIRRGRGYKNLRYLLLKAQRMVAAKTEFVVFRKAA